jgi:hypothetical protein
MNGLFGSSVLDAAIGLIFVYLLLAIICTSLNEWIAGIFSLRAKDLSKAIHQLLDCQSKADNGKDTNTNWVLQQFYKHPLIVGMHKGKEHPSYIPARTFATVLVDVLMTGSQQPAAPQGQPAPQPAVAAPPPAGQDQAQLTFANLAAAVNKLPEGDVKSALRALLRNSEGDFFRARQNIQNWFDDTMDRVSGWYKRKVQVITAVVALALAVGVNADTIRITNTLWHNPEIRAAGVKLAEQRVEATKNSNEATPPAANAKVTYTDPNDALKPTITKMPPVTPAEQMFLNQLVGWDPSPFRNGSNIPLVLLGWLLTAIAVSLGAPFWFDILNKVINIRNSGKSPDEPSKVAETAKKPATTTGQGA